MVDCYFEKVNIAKLYIRRNSHEQNMAGEIFKKITVSTGMKKKFATSGSCKLHDNRSNITLEWTALRSGITIAYEVQLRRGDC